MTTPSTVVYWRGRSVLNGEPIMLLLTNLIRPSVNDKTGPMVQSWILVDNGRTPFQNIAAGTDAAVCGDCKLRKRRCYVNRGPMFVVEAARSAPAANGTEVWQALQGKHLRVGAYGDPTAVPFDIWDELLAAVEHSTGYTHQWRTCDKRFQRCCMASVDSPSEGIEARAAGWRTFRVRPLAGNGGPDDMFPIHEEVICRNEQIGVQCVQCRLCDGSRASDRVLFRRSILITAHGATARNFR